MLNSRIGVSVICVLAACMCLVQGKVNEGDSFDFIIVGSGPGGGTLAARLALARFKVLLVEAGEDYMDDTIRIPYLFAYATDNPEIAWDFWVKHWENTTQQSRDSKYYPDKEGVLYPRASGVGGCGLHHVVNLLYPANQDFEYIQDLFNDDSWSPENMRNIWERIENNRYYPSPTSDDEQERTRYGYNGWMPSETFDYEALQQRTGDERMGMLILFPPPPLPSFYPSFFTKTHRELILFSLFLYYPLPPLTDGLSLLLLHYHPYNYTIQLHTTTIIVPP